MKIETKPGWGNYDCKFIAHVGQGRNAPLTVIVQRDRHSGSAHLYMKVGEVQVVQAELDYEQDGAALAELFNRARLYEFPNKEEDDK